MTIQYSCPESPVDGGPGRLQSMGSLRIGHDSATSLSLFTFTHWRRKWQPTPVFLPGESQGQGSLVGCRLWGCCLWAHTESDTTEAIQRQRQQHRYEIKNMSNYMLINLITQDKNMTAMSKKKEKLNNSCRKWKQKSCIFALQMLWPRQFCR